MLLHPKTNFIHREVSFQVQNKLFEHTKDNGHQVRGVGDDDLCSQQRIRIVGYVSRWVGN